MLYELSLVFNPEIRYIKLTEVLEGAQFGIIYCARRLVSDEPNRLNVSGRNAPKKKSFLEDIKKEALIEVQLIS
jgi:hypothetical protein